MSASSEHDRRVPDIFRDNEDFIDRKSFKVNLNYKLHRRIRLSQDCEANRIPESESLNIKIIAYRIKIKHMKGIV